MNIEAHENRKELAVWLSNYIAEKLQAAIDSNGSASIAVSGGSTPKLLFAELAKQIIDWPNVTITLVDERWVPDTNERSNAKLVKQNLLVDHASSAKFMPLFDDTIKIDKVESNDSLFKKLLPFDVVILGMGNDGHTASFFPGGSKLREATDPATDKVLIDMEAEGAGEPRVTFTLPVLTSAKHLILHIEGEDKKQVLFEATNAGDLNELPIRHVLKARKDLKVVWA